MRVTRHQAAVNRQRIVDSSIRLFSERGVDAVGVAEVMADAGFTHGGFYNHFTSKDHLVVEACSTSFARSVASLKGGDSQQRNGRFGECLSAAMLSESSKAAGPLGSVYAGGVREFLDVMTEWYGDREPATAALARYVGARALCRAVESVDPQLASEFGAALHEPEQFQPRLQASS